MTPKSECKQHCSRFWTVEGCCYCGEVSETVDQKVLIRDKENLKDITAPKLGVQVEIRADGKVLWVHVDGITELRICQIEGLEIVDNRSANRWTSRELADLSIELEGKKS